MKSFFSGALAFCLVLSSCKVYAGYERINCMYYSENYGMWIAASECDNPGTACSVKRCDCSANGAWDPAEQ